MSLSLLLDALAGERIFLSLFSTLLHIFIYHFIDVLIFQQLNMCPTLLWLKKCETIFSLTLNSI